jgi:hypothetical protein
MLPRLVDDIVKMTLNIHKLGKTEGNEEVKELVNNGLKENNLNYDVIYNEI